MAMALAGLIIIIQNWCFELGQSATLNNAGCDMPPGNNELNEVKNHQITWLAILQTCFKFIQPLTVSHSTVLCEALCQ
jgi:hypothetical protein